MDRAAFIRGLIANGQTRFEESDRSWLESLTNEQLARLEPAESAGDPGDDGQDGDGGEGGSANPTALTREQLEARARELNLEVREPEPAPVTREDWLRRCPPDFREQFERGAAMEQSHRAALISAIRGNAAAAESYSEEELKAMKTGDLERLSRAVGAEPPPAEYGGRPLVRPGTGSENGADADPLADEPLTLRAQAGKKPTAEGDGGRAS